MKLMRFVFVTLVSVVLATPALATIDLDDIKPDGFSRGVAFTVNGYDAERSTLTDFLVLVRISEAGISGFDYDAMMFPGTDTDNADRDICFVAADGTPLAYDIDTWDPEGTSLVWVKLPSMENGTEFAMFYRSSKSGKTVCGDNAFSDYVGVWHLNEVGDAIQDILDASPNELAAKSSNKSLAKTDGMVGGARQITSDTTRAKEDKAIKVTYDTRVQNILAGLGRDFSFSLWLRPQGVLGTGTPGGIGYNGILGRKSAGSTAAWQYQIADNVNSARFWTSQTSDQNFGVTANVCSMTRYQWGKLDVVYTYTTSGNAQKITAYWNGVKTVDNITPSGSKKVEQGTTTLAIGGYAGSAERPFCGDMDEVRISTILPTDDRVKADYDTVNVASFLTAGTVAEFEEAPKPVAAFSLLDSGAAFAQFGGSISALGGAATSADVYYKVWPVSGAEPAAWTLLASGLDAGDSFEGIVTNLTPQVAYTNLLKAVNNLETPYDSDIATLPFTTSGAGEAGTGGNAKRVGDDIVHTFTVDPTEGDTWEFVPPTYATAVEALIVAGGGPGGYFGGAGGGAGGLIHDDAFPVTGGATYTVKVGAGGIATSAATSYGTKGGDSLITSDGGATTNAIAYGGGAGGNGNLDNQTATRSGDSGGSGGGSTDANYVGGSGRSGQGNAGGTGLCTPNNGNRLIGAGGGGAGGIGGSVSAGNTVSGGSGGDGRELRISGVAALYAGGGGGGGRDNKGDNNAYGSPGAGGSGVGGNGGMFTVANAGTEWATAGKDSTGSGGGGGSTIAGAYAGANGGSGIVILRYPIQGDGTAMPNPAIALTSASYDADTGEVSFTYRVAWAGYGYQVADVGIAWGYSPSALSTTNTVATDKIGSGSGTVQLPKVSKTVYLRMVATNAGGCSDDSVETAVFTLFNPDAPVGTISVTDTGVTNATFSVVVTDFGTGASSASVTVEVCASEDFTGPVLSFLAAADLEQTGSISVTAPGLANSTVYYARAIVVNNEHVELTTDAIEFSTLHPGAPVGTATTTDLDVGLTTLSASARVTSFGLGSDSAMVRLEVSTESDFSTLAGQSDEVAAVLNTSVPIIATDLTPDTTYYRRVRIRNWWGIDTYVALSVTSTRSVPFSAAGPSWTASGDTVDISLAVSAVYDGAECTAVLTYGGESAGSQTFDAVGTVTWGGLAAKPNGAVAQIVVTTTVDGVDYSKTFSAPVTPGANVTAVTSVTPYCGSGDNALWMRPGDVAMLPDLYGAASYQVLNERFARIDDSVLTALEPGIVGIRCVDASFNTNIMGVVVLPDAIGSGSVYVFNEKNHGNNANAYSWSNSSCWRKVGSDTNDSFPQNADDIAILPFYSSTYGYIRHRSDITIGGLYAGMIRPDDSIVCVLEHYKDDTMKTVTFRRTDGEPVRIQVCPNNDSASYSSTIRLGGFTIDVVWASDAVIDCGSSETDYAKGPRGFFDVKEMSSPNINTNTLQGVTLTFRGYPGYSIGGNNASGCTAQLYGFWKGTGTLVKEGMGGIVINNDIGGLSGNIVLKGQKNPGGINAPSAQFSIRGGGATNLAATVYGVVPIGGYGQPTTSNGAGLFGTSAQVQAAPPTTDATTTFNGASGTRGPDAPAKGLTLVGGSWYAGRIDNKTWGVDAKDDKEIDFLALGPGMSYVQLQLRNSNTDGTPINVVTAKQLRQTERGTLAVTDPSRYKAPTETPGTMFYAKDWADHATGAEGDCTTSAVHPVIPWIVASVTDGNWGNVAFATFDENGRLVQETRENVQITQASSEDANLYMTSKNLNYGTAGGDYTINSLYISNGSNNRWLGADRTLRIKSGGLILQGQSAIGMPGRTDNGALVLGDTTHPAYVWAKAYGSNTNYLGAAVTAAGGFVSAYLGNLCLVGDQTGIAGEIAVNAGTLALGTATESCLLTAGVPIRVCRGAKLFLPKTETLSDNPIKLEGSCGGYGTVELPVDQRAASVSVRDIAESDAWTALPEGTYGSSESSAEFVRDDLFVGPGVLTVGEAKAHGVMFLIY